MKQKTRLRTFAAWSTLASALSSALLAQTTEPSLSKPDAAAVERQLAAIAREAIRHKSGARGLRAILEKAMLEVMYDAPSNKSIKEVVVSGDVILKGEKPLLVFEKQAESA